jgi:hypothetical protein
MTSSHDWDSGTTELPSNGQQTSTGTLDGPADSAGGGAKDRAQQVAGTAKREGAHVASAAKDEAQQVIGEAKDKVTDLVSDAVAQVDEQSRTQLQALASKLEELSGEVDSMVQGSDVQGTVTELARQLSEKTRALSTKLSEREPQELLEDVRGFARQRPGTFLVGALAAGVVAGRLTRGAKTAHDSGDTTKSGSSDDRSSGATTGSSTTSGGPKAAASAGLGGDPIVPEGQNTGGRP